MLFRPLFVIALCLAAVQTWAQSRPDDDPSGGREINIDVDTARARNSDRSLALALLGSAVLPGAGEAYLGQDRSAKAFFLAEASFWAGLFVSLHVRDSYMQSARNYASEYAGADAAGQGEGYLEKLAAYRSYHEKEHRQDSYELAQTLSNAPLEVMPDWDFGSANTPENTAHWKRYQSVMRHYRGAKVGVSFAVGALVLNRVASLAHTLRAYRSTSGKGLGFRFEPDLGPDGSGARLSVNF